MFKSLISKVLESQNWWEIDRQLLNPVFYHASQNLTKDKNEDLALLEDVRGHLLELCKTNNNYEYEIQKKINKINSILNKFNPSKESKLLLFNGTDQFKDFANEQILSLSEDKGMLINKILTLSQKSTGGKPNDKFLKDTGIIIDQFGKAEYKSFISNWIIFLVRMKENVIEHKYIYNEREYVHTTSEYLSALNAEIIKGLIWTCDAINDTDILNLLSKFTERCFKKIVGKGPTAAGIGNACLFVLSNVKGLEGVSRLSRLRIKIKQNNTQEIILKYININEAAGKFNVSIHEIEDMAVDDWGILNNKLPFLFDDYSCSINLIDGSKSEVVWSKADGSILKAAPSSLKAHHAEELKMIKETQKQIDQSLSTQRDRLDRMLRSDRHMDMSYFESKYLQNGILSFFAKKIVWIVYNNETDGVAVIYKDGWINNDEEFVEIGKYISIKLWHPIFENAATIKKWRDLIIKYQIRQPFKQIFREVYLLTEAEINTKSYSNRMAAHILKQHQFNILAKGRGWKYSLMGWYDDGRDRETATLSLSEFALKVEFWINELNADEQYNEAGIWNYVTTDQIRFVNSTNNTVLDLVDVPILPFSEIMRDADLFVGVGSVGNDPNWADNGVITILPAQRTYWESYSFGDLSEVAKNRKEILSTLLPRLKIDKLCEIVGNFLIVKGKIRTYRIHIGSTNILMEPNDQYLCIVPERSTKDLTANLFIPFDGDNALSVIISKAFLLTDDDKITDETIKRQLVL